MDEEVFCKLQSRYQCVFYSHTGQLIFEAPLCVWHFLEMGGRKS